MNIIKKNPTLLKAGILSAFSCAALAFMPVAAISVDQADENQSKDVQDVADDLSKTPDGALVLPKEIVTEERTYESQDARAWSAFYNGDYEAAEVEFKALLNQFDSTTALADKRGFATDLAGRVTVVEFDEESGQVIERKVQLSNGIRKLRPVRRDLIEQYGKVHSPRFQHGRYSHALGVTLIQQGDYAGAKRHLARAVWANRSHDAQMRLGLIALLENDLREAKRRLSKFDGFCASLGCEGDDELGISYRMLEASIAQYEAEFGSEASE